jgi:hypothetical protein
VTDSALASSVAVQNVACVANGPCTLTLSTDGNETSLGTNGRPIFQLRQTTPSQQDVVFTSDYAQVVAGSKKVTLIATAGGSTFKRLVAGIQVLDTPVAPAGSGFANLVDMTISDITVNIALDAVGVTDPRGRTIVYSIAVLPPVTDTNGSALSFNTSTGFLSGGVDIAGGTHTYAVTVTATPTGSTKSLSKTFQLTITDDI